MPQNSSNPALILVHGFRGSPIGLKTIADDLEKSGYQVFVPPIPPFGGAKKLVGYSPETYAEYLINFAKSHNLVKPVLIGHSMGSIIITAATKLYPEFFNDKLILLSPISERPAAPFRLISPLSGLLPAPMIDYITTKFLFIPHDNELFQETLKITHDCSTDHPPKKSEVFAAAKFSTSYAINSFLNNFPNSKEVLIIAGEQDRLVPKKQTLTLAQNLNAKTTFLKDAGHLHNYEQPHETAVAIQDFLQD